MSAPFCCPVCGGEDPGPSRPYRARTDRWPADARVVACPRCGAGSCHPMPSPAWLDDYYAGGSYAASHPDMSDQGTNPLSLGRARAAAQVALVAEVVGPAVASWLDVGGGYGYLLDEARRLGARTAGVEPTPDRRAALGRGGHEAMPDLSSAGDDWSVISLSHVLEHLPRPSEALREVADRLAPGGAVLCEVPNDMPASGGDLAHGVDEPHVLFFSEASLRQLFESAGLTVLALRQAGRRRAPRRLERLRRRGVRWAASSGLVVPEPVARRLHHAHDEGGDEPRIWLRLVAVAHAPDDDGEEVP